MKWVALWLIALSFAGCYTQIRPPITSRLDTPRVERSDADVAERFEFYREHRQDHFLHPYDFGRTSFYDPYDDWPFSDWSYRRSNRLLWQYGVWTSAYDPWWGGYTPAVFVPVVTRVYPTWVYVTQNEQPPPAPLRTRPRVRRAGFDGTTPATSTPQQGTSVTTTQATQPSTQSTTTKESTKQAQEKKKDDDSKEEKREEKRSDQRRRGGMR